MSVVVMGMEMPKSCASCRMAVCFADTGRAKCYATLTYIDPERGKRSYDCPLRPLPEKHVPDFCEAFAVIAEAYKADPYNEILRDYMLKNACCMDLNEGS